MLAVVLMSAEYLLFKITKVLFSRIGQNVLIWFLSKITIKAVAVIRKNKYKITN